jgi:hypothetical protein
MPETIPHPLNVLSIMGGPTQARFGWSLAQPKSLTGSPWMDLLLHFGRQALIPPPNRTPFEQQPFIRPDKLMRMGNEHYAQALGRGNFAQQLADMNRPGLLGALSHSGGVAAPYAQFLQTAMRNPEAVQAAAAIPGLRSTLPYL